MRGAPTCYRHLVEGHTIPGYNHGFQDVTNNDVDVCRSRHDLLKKTFDSVLPEYTYFIVLPSRSFFGVL